LAIAVLGPLGACATETRAPGNGVERVNLGNVSAYLIVRGTEVALVDTGLSRSADAIESALATVGLRWDSVGHIILTHSHPDHIGSLGAAMELANEATAYAGEADIGGITSPRSITPLLDGDSIFGLDILHTPGHTRGHVSVHDPLGRALIAGDSLIGSGIGIETVKGVAGPDRRYTMDMEEGIASAQKMALLSFDALYFGHGEPIQSGADQALRAYLATLS
jgi:glyoxylase-like metal-dependent hydrolase (beta-lactamase superfamily II)